MKVDADIHHWIASRGDTQTTHATILTDSRSLLQKKWNGKPRLARVNVPTSTFLKHPLSGWSLECDPSLLSRPKNLGRTWTRPNNFRKKRKRKKRKKILLHSSVSRDPWKMVDMQSFPILTSPENTLQKTNKNNPLWQLVMWINTYYVHFLWGDKWTVNRPLLLSIMNSVNSWVPDHKTGYGCCFLHAWLPIGDNDHSLYCVLIHPHAYVQF